MEIIVQGHKIDTKEIYDIEDISNSRRAGFIIKLIEKEDITIQKPISYDMTPQDISNEQRPYTELRKQIYEKWQSDKQDIPVFKL